MHDKKNYFVVQGEDYFANTGTGTQAPAPVVTKEQGNTIFVSSGTMPNTPNPFRDSTTLSSDALPYKTSVQKTKVTTYRLKKG